MLYSLVSQVGVVVFTHSSHLQCRCINYFQAINLTRGFSPGTHQTWPKPTCEKASELISPSLKTNLVYEPAPILRRPRLHPEAFSHTTPSRNSFWQCSCTWLVVWTWDYPLHCDHDDDNKPRNIWHTTSTNTLSMWVFLNSKTDRFKNILR